MMMAGGANRERLERMLPIVVRDEAFATVIREELLTEIELEQLDEELEEEMPEDLRHELEEEALAAGFDPDAPMTLSGEGRQVGFLAAAVDRWLRRRPDDPLWLMHPGTGAALTALVCGWASTVMHALAERPRTVGEISRGIDWLGEAAVAERVEEMLDAGLLRVGPEGAGGTSYAATDWMRGAIAPLAAAAWLESRQSSEGSAPPDQMDVEAAFMLTVPLLRLPTPLTGRCRLAVRLAEPPPDESGVTVNVEGGRVIACERGLDYEAPSSAEGSADDWLDTLIEPTEEAIELEGNTTLAGALVAAIAETLFGDLRRS